MRIGVGRGHWVQGWNVTNLYGLVLRALRQKSRNSGFEGREVFDTYISSFWGWQQRVERVVSVLVASVI
jgi:hypothetical protein